MHERAKGQCEIYLPGCWRSANDLHHVWVRSKGGPLVCPDDHAVAACRSCHGKVHAHESKYRELGWIAYSLDEVRAAAARREIPPGPL